MKRIAILFACIFALSACDENPQVIGILRDPSELDFLEITAYADEIELIGGASISPGLADSVFDYTVYIAKDANHFTISAGFNKEGTVTAVCENDGETGMEYGFTGDASKTITLTAQLKHMGKTEYRLTVVRGEPEAVARNIEIWVEPRIGAFFVGSGIIPVLKVKADLPPQGGTFSYQWYANDQDTNRGGSHLSGATGDTYTMRPGETMRVRTVYYYVEITNTIGGRAAVTESIPCKVTFLNKYELDDKSLEMVDIRPGTVTSGGDTSWYYMGPQNYSYAPWSTPGFKMGSCPVTWELWKLVFDHAEAGGYNFARRGNQGAEGWNGGGTYTIPRPVGNELHPVTNISWRDAVVWCNAYSEMAGLDPIYRDSEGNVLKDSREPVDLLIDADLIEVSFDTTKKKGYRLPTILEWYYARNGGVPGDTYWNYKWPGTDSDADFSRYYTCTPIMQYPPGLTNYRITGEVGTALPNSAGLYDIYGLVFHWVWRSGEDDSISNRQYMGSTWGIGGDFYSTDYSFAINVDPPTCSQNGPDNFGFRIVQDRD